LGLKGGDAHRLGRDAAEARNRARRLVAAGRGRYEGSWVHDFVRQLKVLDLTSWTTVFGAELLWSVVASIQVLYERAFEQEHRGWRDTPRFVVWVRVLFGALATAILWLALAVFSSLSLSSTIVDDSKLYGTIGVVFTFLTWFILVATVLVLGAALGAVWQNRTGQGFGTAGAGPQGRNAREPERVQGQTRPG
jgi:hypothetical protein